MNRTTWALLCFAATMFGACHSPRPAATEGVILKDSLTADIVKLSSDEFMGRRPFTEGETKTVNYIAGSFASIGLAPGNGDLFFQDVPMMEITPDVSPEMQIKSPKGSFALKRLEDYVIWSEDTAPEISLSSDDLVFAGFGVVAPEFNWNDYAGLNVKGKVVLVMVNDPGFGTPDTALFKGRTMTYYGRWTYKFEEAARQGAKGCLIIHNTAAASYPFSVVQNSWGSAQMHLDSRSSKEYRCLVEGWITESSAQKILSVAGSGDTSLLSKANAHGFKAVNLGVKISVSMKIGVTFKQSRNVVGKITGTKRPNEYLIYSAHWDHFGIGKPDAKGDSIYNGAADNASGTAALIELARAFKKSKTPPERTIVFLAVTGEEQGLLGSAWYAQHPLYPAESTVANLNTDVINYFGKTRDVEILGEGQSELEDYLKRELDAKGRYIAPEAHPEAGHYFRSDHFSFAKAGVPALTLGSGTDHVEKGKAYGRMKIDEYTANYYHQPSDEYNATTWNLDGAVEDLELLLHIGQKLASETTWPQWKEGSEFKASRKRH